MGEGSDDGRCDDDGERDADAEAEAGEKEEEANDVLKSYDGPRATDDANGGVLVCACSISECATAAARCARIDARPPPTLNGGGGGDDDDTS